MGFGKTNSGGGGIKLLGNEIEALSLGPIQKGQPVYGRVMPFEIGDKGSLSYANSAIFIKDRNHILGTSNDQRQIMKLDGTNIYQASNGLGYSNYGLFIPNESDTEGFALMVSYTSRNDFSSYYFYDFTVYVQKATRANISAMTKKGTVSQIAMPNGTSSTKYEAYLRIAGLIKLDAENWIAILGNDCISTNVVYLITKTNDTTYTIKQVQELNNRSIIVDFIMHENSTLCLLSDGNCFEIQYLSAAKSVVIGPMVKLNDSVNYPTNIREMYYDEYNNQYVINVYSQSYGLITSLQAVWPIYNFSPSQTRVVYYSSPVVLETGGTPGSLFTSSSYPSIYSMLKKDSINIYLSMTSKQLRASVSTNNAFGALRNVKNYDYTIRYNDVTKIGNKLMSISGQYFLIVPDILFKVTADKENNLDLPIGIALTSTTGAEQSLTISLIE